MSIIRLEIENLFLFFTAPGPALLWRLSEIKVDLSKMCREEELLNLLDEALSRELSAKLMGEAFSLLPFLSPS